MTSLRNRIFQLCLCSIFLTLIIACSGGGSVDAVSSQTVTALTTTAGSATTLTVGQTADYTINGGGGTSGSVSYTASSANAAVVTVAVSRSKLSVTGIAAGTATIVVTDNVGNAVNIAVTVSTPTPLTLYAPAGVQISQYTTSQGYQITGGTPPYIVASSAPNVVSATIVNNQLVLTGVSGNFASIAIFDSTKSDSESASLPVIGVTISTAGLVIVSAPPSIDLAVNGQASYVVGTGSGNFAVSSNNTAVATAVINNNNELVIFGVANGTAQVVVSSSTGVNIQTIEVVVSGSPINFNTTAPSPLTSAVSATQTFSVEGGTGPYITNSSDASIVTSSINGNTLSISGIASGAANIYVWDSTGKSPQIIVVTVP